MKLEFNLKVKIIAALLVVIVALLYFLNTFIDLTPKKRVSAEMEEILLVEKNTRLVEKKIDIERKKKKEEENQREYDRKIKEMEDETKETEEHIKKYGIKKVLNLTDAPESLRARKILNDYKNKELNTNDDYIERSYATEFDFDDDGVNEIIGYRDCDCWHFNRYVVILKKYGDEYRNIYTICKENDDIMVINHKTNGYYDITTSVFNDFGELKVLVRLGEKINIK